MYVYGKNVANEMIDTNKKISKAIVYEKFSDKELLNKLLKRNIPIQYVQKRELDNIVHGLHQGIVLSVPDFEYTELNDVLIKENPLLVILDHIEDPHNFGAIIRTCEAAGVDGIIIPKDRGVLVNSTVIKVSTGAIEHIPIIKCTNLNQTISKLKKEGFWIVGTDMQGTSYDKIDYKGKIAIIIGNEGMGMSRLVKESCDFIASIPMNGTTNSLNASVATGIVVYEAIKCRKSD